LLRQKLTIETLRKLPDEALPQKYFLSGPRSGPNENSPALQRWDRDRMSPKSAQRTAEKINKIAGFIQSSAHADLAQCLDSAPSAEALGYSQPSASPTFEAKPPDELNLVRTGRMEALV